MSRTVDVPLSQLRIPNTCVVCLSPASKEYQLEKIFTVGRRSYTVKLNVPMCEQHFGSANFKGKAERMISRLGLIVGVLSGLLVTILLLLYWRNTGQGNPILNVMAGGALGLGLFLIVWALISLMIAPWFAEPTSKWARHAVRITRYWPREQFVRLEFQNERLAETVQNLT